MAHLSRSNRARPVSCIHTSHTSRATGHRVPPWESRSPMIFATAPCTHTLLTSACTVPSPHGHDVHACTIFIAYAAHLTGGRSAAWKLRSPMNITTACCTRSCLHGHALYKCQPMVKIYMISHACMHGPHRMHNAPHGRPVICLELALAHELGVGAAECRVGQLPAPSHRGVLRSTCRSKSAGK